MNTFFVGTVNSLSSLLLNYGGIWDLLVGYLSCGALPVHIWMCDIKKEPQLIDGESV